MPKRTQPISTSTTAPNILARLRKLSGVSVRRLAELAELTPATISLIENDHRLAYPETIEKLTLALARVEWGVGLGLPESEWATVNPDEESLKRYALALAPLINDDRAERGSKGGRQTKINRDKLENPSQNNLVFAF